jgi:hypothetical protein
MSTRTAMEVSLWQRRDSRAQTAQPMRRSRAREGVPRLCRPPKWSERVLPRRVA